MPWRRDGRRLRAYFTRLNLRQDGPRDEFSARFINYSIMQKLTEGYMLSDIVGILGSINVVAAELDR